MIDGKRIVALCAYRIYDPQFFECVTELNEMLKTQDCRLFLYAMNSEIGKSGDYQAEASVYDLIQYDKTDVVIIMAEKIKEREVIQHIIDSATEYNVPCIVVDGDFDNVARVKFDYAKGFEAVVRHVIEYHGCKRPHFVAGKRKSEFSNERIEVFKKVIAENGIAYDDSMLSYGDFWSDPARKVAEELLKRDELPDAVICANDIMAINVCDVFSAAGVRTPEDVIISGFDGIDEAFLSKPGMTTAMCESKALAEAVDETVLEVLKGNKDVEKWIVPSFISNESCGCERRKLGTVSVVHSLNNRFYHHQDDIHIMHVLTSKIMASESLSEATRLIKDNLGDNMCCIVKDACFEVEKEYFLEDIDDSTMSVIYNSYSDAAEIVPYDKEQVIPNLKEALDGGYPLIFNALEYMGKAIGFVCYTFDRYDLIDYSKTPSVTNCLCMGFGGFITIRYQRLLKDKIQKMYQNDALTGLYNRVAFLAKYEEFKSKPQNKGKTLNIIMADLNGLKSINDNHGHAAGDRAIATVAKALRAECPEEALLVRFGGDEMIALVPGERNVASLINKVKEHLEIDSRREGYKIAASYGTYSTVLTEELNLDEIIAIADEQMYKMKKGARQVY